jgi:hypothetical protein
LKCRTYISPSAIATWTKDGVEAFYLKYLSDIGLENEPQTLPMSIGSAFDAYTKSYLYTKLFGPNHNSQFDFEAIFESQVESCNRTWARTHGKKAFDDYNASGALGDLFADLSKAKESPCFEFEVRGLLTSKNMEEDKKVFDLFKVPRDPLTGKEFKSDIQYVDNGLVLLGKPDCYYINKDGHPVILDWKVNGWCGKSNTSPKPGFVKLRHCDGTSPKLEWHKDAVVGYKNGIKVNLAKRLEDVDVGWAGQLSVYGWLCGEEVGNEFLTCIDQLACSWTGGFPTVRVAEHRTWVSAKFQHDYLDKAREIWEIIHSNHIFRDLSFEENLLKCKTLDNYTLDASQPRSAEDELFKKMTRKTQQW